MNAAWQKFLHLLQQEFKKGLSTQSLAMAISFGVMFGVFPIIGTSSLICFLLAVVFKLNQVVIQSVNYLVYPLQFVLIPIWVLISALFLPKDSFKEKMSEIQLSKLFEQTDWVFDLLQSLVLGWAVVMLPFSVVLFFVLRTMLKKLIAE